MYLGAVALILALLAAVPSAAVFTPAVFVSLFALVLASAALLRGGAAHQPGYLHRCRGNCFLY